MRITYISKYNIYGYHLYVVSKHKVDEILVCQNPTDWVAPRLSGVSLLDEREFESLVLSHHNAVNTRHAVSLFVGFGQWRASGWIIRIILSKEI